MIRAVILAAGLVAALPIAAAPVSGTLEMRWGDPPPGSAQAARFEVGVVDADGRRHAIDADSALRASGDLFRQIGRPVTVTVAEDGLRDGRLRAETIMPYGPVLPAGGVTGSRPWATLLCRFADVPAEPNPPSYFETLMSDAQGRLDHYWQTVSYGKVDIAGSAVYGWFTLPHPRSHYIPDGESADLLALFQDCTGVADATVDFSNFVGINTMYNADLDCCAWGGSLWAALDGPARSWYVTWEPPWGYANQAPLAHEMGHGFGLPHANNSDRDGDPYDNPWDVMSGAWYNVTFDSTFGWQPQHIGIWSRDHLGWVDPERQLVIDSIGVHEGIVLDRASLADSSDVQMIKVTIPGAPASRHYLIEARVRTPLYEGALAGDAVIITEVDGTRVEPAWSVDADVPPADVSNNAGSMFVVGESWTAPDDAMQVDVVGRTDEGFVLNVRRGVDAVFADGFD